MSIDLTKVQELKNNENENRKIAKNLSDLVKDINKSIKDTETFVINLSVYNACSWIEWNELWLDDKYRSPKNTNSYKRRKLINVELGYSQIGSEAAFNHPAVVLYEEKDWVLIAPITSKKYGKGLDLLIDVPSGSCAGLTDPSTIQLDHIRAISKKRITGTRTGSLPTQYMDKINEALLKKIIPHIHKEYVNLKEKNDSLSKDIRKMQLEINILREKNKFLESKL